MKNLNQLILLSILFMGTSMISSKKETFPETDTNSVLNKSITDTTTNYFLFAEIDGNSWDSGDTTTLINFGVEHFNGWSFDDITTTPLKIDYLGYFIHRDAVNGDDLSHDQIAIGLSGYSYNTSSMEIDCNTFQTSLANPVNKFYSSSTPNQFGFEIIYLDTMAKKWSTKFGDQTGSSFTITYNNVANPIVNSGQTCARKYRGTFSCKVYKESNPSEYKVITNGRFHAHISKYDE